MPNGDKVAIGDKLPVREPVKGNAPEFPVTCYIVPGPTRGHLTGSAVLIDSQFALTAAHNLFNKEYFYDGRAKNVEVTPGFSATKSPRAPMQIADQFVCHEQFEANKAPEFDIALIRLPRPYTHTNSFADLQLAAMAAPTDSLLRAIGYPKVNGTTSQMYRFALSCKAHRRDRIFYPGECGRGLSGGPVFAGNGNDLRLVGVHAYGRELTPKGLGVASSATALRVELIDWISKKRKVLGD